MHSDSSVCLYTYDYNEQYTLGNLRAESFRNICYRIKYQLLRQRLRKNLRKAGIWSECRLYL